MNIAVWYHCKVSGSGIPDRGAALEIVRGQMSALAESGLAKAAEAIHLGVNGSPDDAADVKGMAPEKALLHFHGKAARSELPTFALLRRWLPTHSNWAVFYHHSKGVTQPASEEKAHHRELMEKALVWNWTTCLADLLRGFEAVGINLVDPDTRPIFGKYRFFAGNFWWAQSNYLLQLPPLPASVTEYSVPQRCLAEMWIGRCQRRPIMLDYERPELYEFWQERGMVKKRSHEIP